MDNKGKIFEFLYKQNNDSYNINQISRLVGISVGSAFKVLKALEQHDYVVVSRKNNALLYQINMSYNTKELHENIEEEENKRDTKKTKVVCTIGIALNASKIKKLVEKGMDVARIDVSYLVEKDIIKIIQNIRQATDEIPILLDICKNPKYWINFAMENDLDFVSITAADSKDVHRANKLLGYSDLKQVIGDKIKVLNKIGSESLKNYKEIVAESYGIIIDRNKLASGKIEMLPRLQKEIIDECNKFGKPIIIAGNVLDSMICSKQPTQSEIYDVSNAVLGGASCLTLSKETVNGNYPIEAIQTLSRIIKNAEIGQLENIAPIKFDSTHFILNAIFELEKNLHVDALLIITSGGYSARMISSRRVRFKTIAVTSRKKIFRQLRLLWGIKPLHVKINTEDISNEDKKESILKALKKGFIGKSDQIAIIASIFHSKSKRTNLLEIHKVSEFLDYLDRKKVSLEV